MAMAPLQSGDYKVNINTGELRVSEESQSNRFLIKDGINCENPQNPIMAFLTKLWRLGDDYKTVVHSLKVALALTIVFVFNLLDTVDDRLGNNAVWAVLTVVVVFEFTAGATLSKGLNRGIGTLVAGTLAVLVCYVCDLLVADLGEIIVIGTSIFIIGAVSTYFRFNPSVKKRFDYGVMIFLLTFSMITVSGFHADNIFRMAYERLSIVLVGFVVCLIISLMVYPNWAGTNLHNSIAEKFEALAKCIDACVHNYFEEVNDKIPEEGDDNDTTSEDPIYEGYMSLLDSKATDESLATFAGWEPRHGKFRYRHPWKQYVKVASKLRYLSFTVAALHGCLHLDVRAPRAIRSVLKTPCNKAGNAASRALRELSCSFKSMRRCDVASVMKELKVTVMDLQASFRAEPNVVIDCRKLPWQKDRILPPTAEESETVERTDRVQSKKKTWKRLASWQGEIVSQKRSDGPHVVSVDGMERVEFGEALPLATFACLLVEIVARIEQLVQSVDELAEMAHFRQCNPSPKC